MGKPVGGTDHKIIKGKLGIEVHGREALALLLVESGTLLKSQVVDAIEGIIEVKQEVAGVSESVVVSIVSIGLLRAIAQSIAAAAVPKPGLAL